MTVRRIAVTNLALGSRGIPPTDHWNGALAEDSDIVSLMRWEVNGPIPGAFQERLKVDPDFARAARALAVNMLAAGAADKALDGIFKDAGRYLVAMWAVCLHVSGGLTLPRLKEICARSGFLSPGRARALLIYLRYLGYVELFPSRHGGLTRYLPTGRFLGAWRRQLRAALEAASIVEPAARLVLDRLNEPEVFDAFVRLQSRGLLDWARQDDGDMAFVRVFMHPNAGTQIVWTLLAAGGDDIFPPRDPLRISLAGTARRFGVSRVHVRRILDDAEAAGILRCVADGAVVLEDKGRSEIEYLYAGQLTQLLASAAGTLRERPELTAPPSDDARDRLPPARRASEHTRLDMHGEWLER